MNETFKILLYYITFSFSIQLVIAQKHVFRWSLESNGQYYIDNLNSTGNYATNDLEQDIKKNPIRANNYFKIDYSRDKLFARVQLESYLPKSLAGYSENFQGTNLAIYHLGYQFPKTEIVAGYFYEQFGNGLVLRTNEDRVLGWNNALRGLRIRHQIQDAVYLKSFWGQQRYGFKISKGHVWGIDAEVNVSNFFKQTNDLQLQVGVSYLGRYQAKKLRRTIDFPSTTNVIGARLNFSKGNYYINLEYVYKGKDALVIGNHIKNAQFGNALLWNLGYTQKGVLVDIVLRRLENMQLYSDRSATANIFNENLLNYLPSLSKQQKYTLTNIYVYQAQTSLSFLEPKNIKVGEIGGSIHIEYLFAKRSVLGGKYGMRWSIDSSYWWGLKGDLNFEKQSYQTDFIGFGTHYYSDISVEINKKWYRQWHSVFYYLYQHYNKQAIEETYGKAYAHTVVVESTHQLTPKMSIRWEVQHLWNKNDKKNWLAGTLELHWNYNWTFFIQDTYNYENRKERVHYYNLGFSYTKNQQRFSLGYGRQRGGLICIGGICRFVPQTSGFSASVTLSF